MGHAQGPASRRVDLSNAEVIDNHVHAFRIDELLDREPLDFETRLTMMGTCFLSSRLERRDVWSQVKEQTGTTVFSLAARRWLAERLGCAPTAEALAGARDAAIHADPAAYVKDVVADANVAGLITDEGYPQPPIPAEEFEAAVGTAVHRVARIEPWIAAIAPRADGFVNLLDEFEQELDRAAADPRLVAYKSIIAYRTGVDVQPVRDDQAAAAFDRWRVDGFAETREHAKPVRDFLLARAADAAKRHGLAMHIHCGDGDPDVVFGHARPQDLFPFLRDHQDQSIVLIHAGHPWSEESAYIASVMPHVYIDLSVLIPWASSAIDQLLARMLGMVPASKLLYGSDQASEPEVLWIAARMARGAVERVLSDALDRDYLTPAEADAIGRGILADNTRRLHRLDRKP